MTTPTRRKVLANTAAVFAAAVGLTKFAGLAHAHNGETHTHHVDIQKFKFDPDLLQVWPGDTIIWTNHDVVPHTATATDKSWDTGTIKKGMSKSLLVTETMLPDYYCRFHPAMKARLELTAENGG